MQVLGWCQRPLAAIGIVLALGTSAFAQSGLADIRGTVVDDSNAALPGVSVTATHIDTGTSRTADSAGAAWAALPPRAVSLAAADRCTASSRPSNSSADGSGRCGAMSGGRPFRIVARRWRIGTAGFAASAG